MDIKTDLMKEFRSQQQKYVYYIIALSVTSIGFSIFQTMNEPLKITQIPLGLAILSWGFSIFFGLSFIRYIISSIYANIEYFNVIEGNNPDVVKKPQFKDSIIEGIKQAIQSNSKKTTKLFKSQNYLFYFGVVLFILWRIIEMYYKTK